MASEAWTFLGLDASDLVVLAIGVATIGAMVITAWIGARVAGRQAAAAEKQLEASEAALGAELQAVIVLTRGTVTNDHAIINAHNGGRYPAIDLSIDCSEQGTVVASGSVPIVGAGSQEGVRIPLASTEQRDAFNRCDAFITKWSDGLGAREEPLRLLTD